MAGEIVDLVEQVVGLFGIFPLNVILIGGLGTIAFSWFKKAKGAVK